MASSENTDGWSSAENIVKLEAEYKKDKARVKSSFSRAKNRLIGLLEQQELPSRNEVQDACRMMDSCAELAKDVLTNFSEFYIRINEMQKSMCVSNEAENSTTNTVPLMKQPLNIFNRGKMNDPV